MERPTFYVLEHIDDNWETGSERDLLYNLQDGHHVMDLILTGDRVRLYFEKSNASDDGTPTTCYIDNFRVTQNRLEIIEENNYYPFGGKHKGYNTNVSANSNSVAKRFKYNGTELEESLGLNLYEMPLRQYDPAIGRWTGIDPVTHYSKSTYNGYDNNPVFWADPSGADGEHYNWETSRYEDGDGNEVSFEETMQSIGIDLSSTKESQKEPDDWFLNKKTGEIAHAPDKTKGYEKELGEDWVHFAKEDEISDPNNVTVPSNSVFIFNIDASKKLMDSNGLSLVPTELLRDISVRYLTNIPNPKIDISIKQENIEEIWLSMTYVPKTSVAFNDKFKVLQDISLKQGYRQYQRVTRTYSNNFFTRMMNYGKSIHKKGSADSAGSSLTTYIGWENYKGPLSKFK